MKADITLKLTLEEYGYKLSDLIYPANGLEMAIKEAMKRNAKDYHYQELKKLTTPKSLVSKNKIIIDLATDHLKHNSSVDILKNDIKKLIAIIENEK